MVLDNIRKIQCGALFITQYETVESITFALDILNKHMVAQNVNYKPRIFMSDKDDGQIGALRVVFKDTTIWLCTVHVDRAWFRVIPAQARTKQEKDEVFNLMTTMMYSRDQQTCNQLQKQILRKCCPRLKNYLLSEWFQCKELWCFSYRVGIFTNRINTNNIVEAFNKYVSGNISYFYAVSV